MSTASGRIPTAQEQKKAPETQMDAEKFRKYTQTEQKESKGGLDKP